MSLWEHQSRCLAEFFGLVEVGPDGPICVTSPTGGGKTRMMVEKIQWAADRDWRTVLYTNRKLLTDQISEVLRGEGITHGVRAAEHLPILTHSVQVASIHTENVRVYKRKKWELHDAKLVLVDEAHQQKGYLARKLISDHLDRGAIVVGYTATPLGIGMVYKHLIVAGNNSELRACGAHVPCHTYGPDEPDTKNLKRTKTGEYTENDVRKVIMTPTIFGRVYDWWKKLNPDGRPTILFAPGVGESRWFAQQFAAAGVRAAHIDGEDIHLDGREYKSDRDAREQVIGEVRTGAIQVICNRFVLREGIDIPELYHGILATVFGSVQSYLQSGGRLLRNHPSLPGHVILQDHGGNWWRHGSLNSDREWRLEYDANMVSGLREQRLRQRPESQPVMCPECHRGRLGGTKCPYCGFETPKRVRFVVQRDGSLKEMLGDVFKPRRVQVRQNTRQVWERMYHRAKRAGMTFRQAEGLFVVENHYWPPRDLPMMPQGDLDWFRKVADVPYDALIGRERVAQ